MFEMQFAIGNDAFRNPFDHEEADFHEIAEALRRVAEVVDDGASDGVVKDAFGNVVGEFHMVEY